MAKQILNYLRINNLPTWLLSIPLAISLLSFTGDRPNLKKADHEYTKRRHYLVNKKPTSPYFDSDPIRFTLRADRKQVSLGDEVTFTITAHYLNVSPALLFLAEGSNAFRLKLLLPDGFVQTGGSYSDYVGTELSTTKSTISYTLKGYFTKAQDRNEFRLLRGSGNADETSLFVEKARLSISVNDYADQSKNGRLASNCDYTEGQFLLNWYGEQIYAHYYNGILFASYQDPSQGFKPQSWLQATGFDGSKVGCFAMNDPHTSTTNPPVIPPSGTCSVSSPNASFDFADCNGIGGWALDQANVNQPVLIDIYVDGVKTYAGVTANGDRQDLVQYFGANGRYHGFNYSFPANASWKNGQNHTISVRICGVNNEIGGSPKTVSGCTGGTTTNPTTPTTNPPSTNCGTGSGLTGFYSNSSDLSGNLAAIRNDAQINFTWGDSPIPGVVNADGFSIRWFGQIEAPASGNYTFKTNNDDGTRVWVNGQLLIDDWNGHGPTWQQGSVYLNGGQKYDITIDYFDYWGGAQAQLYWEYPGQGLQLVPSCRLYSNLRYDQASQTYRNGDPDASSCPEGSAIERAQIGCATIWICNSNGRIFEMNLTQCEPVSGPSGGTPPSDTPPGNTPSGTPVSPSGGPGTVPGGTTNPGIPKFRLPIGLSAKELALNKFYGLMQFRGITFSSDEKVVISEFYPDLMNNISTYVNQYGSKPTLIYLSLNLNIASNEQIKNAINNLLDPGKPRGMTDLELNLLGYGTPSFTKNLKQYYANAREATLRAVIRYGFHDAMETGTTVANAFKHSLLAIIHTQSSFGRQFSKQLVDAHESESPLMDGDMDRHNNEQGFRIYDADPNQSVEWYDNTVWNNVNNGLMRYMVQRLENGEWRWFLIPTNQH